MAAILMPKSVPLRAITMTMLLPSTPSAGFDRALARGHAEIEEPVIVAIDELDHFGERFIISIGAGQRRADRAQEQAGARPIAIVPLVAHVQRLRDQRLHVDAVRQGLQGPIERGIEIGLHPLEARDHFRPHAAVAQHFAQTFVLRAKGAIAKGLVLEDEHRHRRRHDARHRPDGVMMMARRKLDVAGSREFFRFGFILRETFVDQRAHHRAALRAAHPIPRDGRAGVQNQMLVHAGDHVPRDAHADQRRSRGLDALDRFLVGGVDVDAVLRHPQARHALDGRLPIDIDHGHALIFHRLRHAVESDVDNAERLAEEIR